MLDIRLIATDLDGTLLGGEKEIPELNIRALQEAERRGIQVVLASGRSYSSVRLIARKIGLKGPIISANGGRVDEAEPGHMLLNLPLTGEKSRKVYELCKASGLYFEIYHNGIIYSDNYQGRPNWSQESFCEDRDGVLHWHLCDPERMEKEAVAQADKYVVFTLEEEAARLAELREAVKKIEGLNVNSSWYTNIEILDQNAGKGKCLDFLAQGAGLAPDQVMAFGDNLNDKDMLEYAGWPVLMENGLEELRPLARIIAPRNTLGGVGKVLYQYVLGEEKL